MRKIGVLLLACAAGACTGEAGATSEEGPDQDGLTLEAAYPESFGMVRGVRELPDGTVLVADPLAKVLLKVDMEGGSAETIGSEGQGPGEYRQPDVVYPIPDGKTLLVDLGNARISVLESDLSFGETFPLAQGRPGPGGDFQVRIPQAVDGQGRIYFRAQAMMMGRGEPPTHAPVMRWDPWSSETEEVAQVQLPRREVSRSGPAGEQNVSIRQIPLTPEDGWSVGPNGQVALARVEPAYRLDWVSPSGVLSEGASVDYDPVPIGTAEKEDWIDGSARRGGGIQISIEANNNDIRTTFSRGGGAGEQSVNDYDWPEMKPPFESNGVLVSPAGEAWVLRSAPAGSGVTYDVFDSSGAVRTQVKFDGSRRVIAFGERSVYVVRFDEYDLQYLEKYSVS